MNIMGQNGLESLSILVTWMMKESIELGRVECTFFEDDWEKHSKCKLKFEPIEECDWWKVLLRLDLRAC